MRAELSGKVAIIGGSTRGIGKAIALKLAQNGADIVVNGRDSQAGLETTKEIERLQRRSLFEQADLTKYEEVKEMTDNVLKKWGTIDIVVANGAAKFPYIRFFHEIEPNLYSDFIQSILFTRLHMIRAVLDHMREKKMGKIIITCTDAGRVPTSGESLIGAAGAGMVMVTKVLAQEFSRWKIHVNTICTTVTIDTPGYDMATSQESTGKIFRKAAERVPFWPITPNDLAELALFLASEDSDRITGQIFSINGGLSFPG